jgi:hypothetical protein
VACAAAIVGAVINATEAVAAISPLKPTSASPFVLEPDLLDFGFFLIGGSRAVYPGIATRFGKPTCLVASERFTKPDANASTAIWFIAAQRTRPVVAGKLQWPGIAGK